MVQAVGAGSMEEDPQLDSMDRWWRALCNGYREEAGTTNVSHWMGRTTEII